MDTREQTLDAIQQYITTQRALLLRTQSDIDRLLKLRREAIEKPTEFLSTETNSPFDLKDISECAPALPENVDWSLYALLDPSPLRTLTHNITTHSYTHLKEPHKTQRSPLSPLQRFVKEARVSILEPVLGVPTPTSSTSTSTPSANTPRVSKPQLRRLTTTGRHSRASTVDLNTPATSVSFTFASPTPSLFPLQTITTTATSESQSKLTRVRRPSTKFAEGNFVDSTPAKRKRSSGIVRAGEDVLMEPPAPVSTPVTLTLPPIKLGKRARRASSPPSFRPSPKIDSTTQAKTKIKPQTYKQAWTVSEQHLLERLLDEIPEGEKNRWQKISQAMQGRRTPRQVASRVQKYFEKLKQFGIGVLAADARGDDEPA